MFHVSDSKNGCRRKQPPPSPPPPSGAPSSPPPLPPLGRAAGPGTPPFFPRPRACCGWQKGGRPCVRQRLSLFPADGRASFFPLSLGGRSPSVQAPCLLQLAALEPRRVTPLTGTQHHAPSFSRSSTSFFSRSRVIRSWLPSIPALAGKPRSGPCRRSPGPRLSWRAAPGRPSAAGKSRPGP